MENNQLSTPQSNQPQRPQQPIVQPSPNPIQTNPAPATPPTAQPTNNMPSQNLPVQPNSAPTTAPIATSIPNEPITPTPTDNLGQTPKEPFGSAQDKPKKSLIANPIISKIIIGLSIAVVVLGLFFLFFRLPVTITTNPSANLTFDNQSKGESASFNFWIRPGKHTLRLEKVGYDPKTVDFNQSWFSLTKLSYNLDPAPSLKPIDAGTDALIITQNNTQLLLYFNPTKKAFFTYSFANQEKLQITPAIFSNLTKLVWNPSGNGVIIWVKYDPKIFAGTILEDKTISNNTIATFYYDFHHYEITNQTATLWGTDIFKIAWATTADRFYYIGGQSGNGYLGKAENNGQTKTKLLTNLPFNNGDLAIDSQEINTYILGNNKLYQVDLTDPARSLSPLGDATNTHLIFIDDTHLLLGSNQANPEDKSQEKYTLYNLAIKQFEGSDFYANQDWIYALKNNNFLILQAKTSLASNQPYWLLQKISLPAEKNIFSYEYLTAEIPTKIWYNDDQNILIVNINNQLYQLKIVLK
jgi:hypothetical protein